MKKMRIISAAIVVVVALSIAIFMVKDKPLQKYSTTVYDMFDTVTDITGYAKSEEDFDEQVEPVIEKLSYYNRIYDIYNDYDGINNIKTINDNAGIAPVKVDDEVINLIKYGKEIYEDTDGYVNIAFGSVLCIWHEYREAGLDNPDEAAVPGIDILMAANEHTNIDDVIIDEEAGTVFLKDKDMSLDVGGIAKGYATQRAADYARELGIESMLFNVGGNIACVGYKEENEPYKIGIQNPNLESSEPYIEKLEIADGMCVVSSGDYQRYYVVDGVKYCHIINPNTLYPSTTFKQVSVVATDSGFADGLSTALFNMSFEDGLAFVESLDGVEAMWVFDDDSISYSSNFGDYMAE